VTSAQAGGVARTASRKSATPNTAAATRAMSPAPASAPMIPAVIREMMRRTMMIP
jgi:hypothetical protein